MVTKKRYSIVFDNQCGVCNLGAKTMRQAGIMKPGQTIALSEYSDNELACNVDPSRACDEMAVIDLDDLSVVYGVKGWAQVIGEKKPQIGAFLGKPVMVKLLTPVYKLFAFNRRLIAPIKDAELTCEPSLNKFYRVLFLILIAFLGLAVTFASGAVLKNSGHFDFLSGVKLLAVKGPAWFLLWLMVKKDNNWDLAGHISMVVFYPLLIQAAALLVYTQTNSIVMLYGAMLLSVGALIYLFIKRGALLGFSISQRIKGLLVIHIWATVALAFWYYLAQ